jgi:hypothetical protein
MREAIASFFQGADATPAQLVSSPSVEMHFVVVRNQQFTLIDIPDGPIPGNSHGVSWQSAGRSGRI